MTFLDWLMDAIDDSPEGVACVVCLLVIFLWAIL